MKVAKVTREFREQFEAAVLPKTRRAPKLPALEVGARVRLKDIREPATVMRMMGNERIEVQAGFMKMQVSRATCRRC